MIEQAAAARLSQNLERIRTTIAEACSRSGRAAGSVTLVAVTKYVPPAVIEALPAAGQLDIGENRVQQLVARAQRFGSYLADWSEPIQPPPVGGPPRWHMIGHLQRNKVKQLLPHARIVHSLDSARLAAEIDSVAQRLDVGVDVLLEVNVAGEASKSGAAPTDVEAIVQAIREHTRIRLRGLMTMPPFDPDPEHSRPYFARLREMLSRLRESGAAGPECTHLSMGMSQDYAVAVEEGATFVRVGSALYEGLPEDVLGYAT